MAVLNPDHLFEQATKLVAPPPAGAPRQADLRRAISTAYYAVFHYLLTAGADEFVGRTSRATPRYALVYRSVDHRSVRLLCDEAKKMNLPAKYSKYLPPNGLGPNIQAFATALVDLQEKRHSADYDPLIRVTTSDARLAIATAKSAVRRFRFTSATRRKTFLALLFFAPR